MPLVVVCPADRSRRKFVTVDTVESVIHSAAQKLNLDADGNFKLYVDYGPEKGMEVDDDDVLKDLSLHCSSSGKHLILIVLPSTDSWTPLGNDSSPARSTSQDVSTDNGSANDILLTPRPTSPNIILTPPATPRPPPLPINPIREIFEPVQEALVGTTAHRNILKLKRQALKEAAQFIATFMLKKALYTRPVAAMYASCVLSYGNGLFKPIFAQVINKENSDDGLDAFICSIYNMVNYRKGDENKKKRSSRILSTEEDPDGELEGQRTAKSPRLMEDDYGCVQYSPHLPDEETLETQEEKRLRLLTLDPDDSASTRLMRQTYATQRSEINGCQISKLGDVLCRWPLLLSSAFVIEHSSTLLGKNVPQLWADMLGKRTDDIISYLSAFAKLESEKGVTVPNYVKEMLKVLEDMKQEVDVSQSSQAKSLAAFMLIIAYMKEDRQFLMKHVEDAGDDNAMLIEAAGDANGNPIVVVQGRSLFDCDKCGVVVLNSHLIKCRDALDAVLTAFLSFYVFGFKYTKETQASLEFIQRFFLCINPKQGDKRAKARRGVSGVCSKVLRLSEALAGYANQWTVS